MIRVNQFWSRQALTPWVEICLICLLVWALLIVFQQPSSFQTLKRDTGNCVPTLTFYILLRNFSPSDRGKPCILVRFYASCKPNDAYLS